MWTPLARRAFLSRRAAATKFHQILQSQVPQHEPIRSIKPTFHISNYSTSLHFYENPRFFSSNASENYEDPPISDRSKAAVGIDFSAFNPYDESAEQEIENEDALFDVSDDTFVGNDNSDVLVGGSDSIYDGNVGYVEEGSGSIDEESEVMENDPEKVENLLSLLQSSGSVEGSLESKLEGMGLVLDEDFVIKVLGTPVVPGENLIGFFGWAMKNPDFKVTTLLIHNLILAIGHSDMKNDVYALVDLVKEVAENENGVVTTECLNGVIGNLSMIGEGKAAFNLFNEFEGYGCVPNSDTFYLTIKLLCKRNFYDWASLVCEKMLASDNLPDSDKIGNIIFHLCKGRREKDAHLVYLYAKDKKKLPLSSLDLLISSFSRIEKTKYGNGERINKELDKERVSVAIEMLNDYSDEERKLAHKSYTSVIKKLCWIADVGRAKNLLLEMIEADAPLGNLVFNCVINGLSKLGDMVEAREILKMMENRGLKPDVYTYTVIMSGYIRVLSMDEACEIFEEAKRKHSKLTSVTYHSLIRGFCKLEQYDKAVNLLGEMRQHGLNPNHDEYNKLIKSLCLKALDCETAEKLREEMKENGIILNGRTSALINAVKELKNEAVKS